MRLILTGHHLTAITSSAHGFDTEYAEVPFNLAVIGSLVVEREFRMSLFIIVDTSFFVIKFDCFGDHL